MNASLSVDVHELEARAAEMTRLKSFSYDQCEKLLLQLAAVKEAATTSNRQAIEPGKNGSYMVLGLFSHGPMSGITRKTHELPELCRYLNLFGRHQLGGSSARWTSCTININQPARVHLDPHNCPNSNNFTCSFGPFEGGELWVELTEGCDSSQFPVRWKTKHNGQRVPGHLHSTMHRFIQF